MVSPPIGSMLADHTVVPDMHARNALDARARNHEVPPPHGNDWSLVQCRVRYHKLWLVPLVLSQTVDSAPQSCEKVRQFVVGNAAFLGVIPDVIVRQRGTDASGIGARPAGTVGLQMGQSTCASARSGFLY